MKINLHLDLSISLHTCSFTYMRANVYVIVRFTYMMANVYVIVNFTYMQANVYVIAS